MYTSRLLGRLAAERKYYDDLKKIFFWVHLDIKLDEVFVVERNLRAGLREASFGDKPRKKKRLDRIC